MAAEAEVFVYMGEGGPAVPRDAVRVRVHPSVTRIRTGAFQYHRTLEEVELCEGLLEIGMRAFSNCVKLKRISIPSTVTRLCSWVFCGCKELEEIELKEGLIEIERCAFLVTESLKKITIPTTVTIIHENAFNGCKGLERIELPEGLLEIRKEAFFSCSSLEYINFPSTLKTIGYSAFCHTKTSYFSLSDGIESIGNCTFLNSELVKFRVPSLITTIPSEMLSGCRGMFSLELPESINRIEASVFANCKSLRNVTIPTGANIEENSFLDCLGGGSIIHLLKQRFDNLPIHRMIYYQSYNTVTVDQLNEVTNLRKRVLGSKLNPTGNLRDFLGMTPLHIMACSTVHNIELYRVLIEKYPDTLITEDRWKAVPLLYAMWGNVPDDIIQFLVESYQSIHPDFELNWTDMVVSLGRADAPKKVIQNLFRIQRESFPHQSVEWATILSFIIRPGRSISTRTSRVLIQCSVSVRIDAIGVRQWREQIKEYIEEAPELEYSRSEFITAVEEKLVLYENKYYNLKEATSLLELALWKHKMDDHCQASTRRIKRIKIEESAIREQCHINCGADVVIEHVLSYLLPDANID